jgi:hypothetical protein
MPGIQELLAGNMQVDFGISRSGTFGKEKLEGAFHR